MADRYWVGGTASWDGTAGTKWALTSGGAGGQAVPTTADDVFFSSASTGTVTVTTGSAKSINCTGFTGTITGIGSITVAGSVTLVAGMTYTHTGTVSITGTGTLTTAGKTFGTLSVGGTVTLGDALNTSTRNVTITLGTFNTNNFNVSCLRFNSTNSNVRAINLGSSTLTVETLDFTTSTNLTFNAGTSQISASTNFRGGSQTFYNVTVSPATVSITTSLTGNNIFNNLTTKFTGGTGAGETACVISGDQIINGTYNCSGDLFSRRSFIRSNVAGLQRTLTVATFSGNNCAFRDIALAGAASGSTPTGAGDCDGNSGIVFSAPKTVYRVGTSNTWFGVSSWALTSGGSGSDSNFPLGQDAIIIDNGAAPTGALILGTNNANIRSLDCTNRTSALTLTFTGSSNYYGDLRLSNAITTASSSGTINFFHRNTVASIVTAGVTVAPSVLVQALNGTVKFLDAYNSTSSISLTAGTLDANNFNITVFGFTTSGTNARTLTMGSGLWTITGSAASVWDTSTTTNLTFNKDTADISITANSGSGRIFDGGGLSYNKLIFSGTSINDSTTINGANSFTEFASNRTTAYVVRFGTNGNTIGTWSISGTPGNLVTVNSSTATVRRTFTLTNVATGIDYLSIKDIGELSDNKFYVGANSTDGGNNDNVYFSAPLFNVGNMFAMFASA